MSNIDLDKVRKELNNMNFTLRYKDLIDLGLFDSVDSIDECLRKKGGIYCRKIGKKTIFFKDNVLNYLNNLQKDYNEC